MRKKSKKTDSDLITLDAETSQFVRRRAKFFDVSPTALLHVAIGEHFLKEYLQGDESLREELRRLLPGIAEAAADAERVARKGDAS